MKTSLICLLTVLLTTVRAWSINGHLFCKPKNLFTS